MAGQHEKRQKDGDSQKGSLEVYDVAEEVRKGARRAKLFIRKHPWESVGIAALAGAVVCRLLFWRKRSR